MLRPCRRVGMVPSPSSLAPFSFHTEIGRGWREWEMRTTAQVKTWVSGPHSWGRAAFLNLLLALLGSTVIAMHALCSIDYVRSPVPLTDV